MMRPMNKYISSTNWNGPKVYRRNLKNENIGQSTTGSKYPYLSGQFSHDQAVCTNLFTRIESSLGLKGFVM